MFVSIIKTNDTNILKIILFPMCIVIYYYNKSIILLSYQFLIFVTHVVTTSILLYFVIHIIPQLF